MMFRDELLCEMHSNFGQNTQTARTGRMLNAEREEMIIK